MILSEKEFSFPRPKNNDGLLQYFSNKVLGVMSLGEVPVRFVVTRTDEREYFCELGVLHSDDEKLEPVKGEIFKFQKRKCENTEQFNAVLLVPTGIGAAIGGHSGDACPVARLLASVCDNLITHPNVVNAADINELPENALYVEGSVISRLLMGAVGLQKVRSNRVLVIIDEHPEKTFHELAINSVSAARATLGLDCPAVIKMDDKVIMRAMFSNSGRAVGRIEYFERLCDILEEYKGQYDAIALSSLIEVPKHFHIDYFKEDMPVNPWGGVEAMLTHAISLLFNIQSSHSPMMTSSEILDLDVGIVDPRKSAEAVSITYLHCILKGLHRSPRIITDQEAIDKSEVLNVSNISCLVIPDGCVGLPTLAALEQEIPVIAVRENKNRMKNNLEELPFVPRKLFIVDNYLEAVGVMSALKAGVPIESVRRPLPQTKVEEVGSEADEHREDFIEEKIE